MVVLEAKLKGSTKQFAIMECRPRTSNKEKLGFRLLTHTEFGNSNSEYVMVKGEDSPFIGGKNEYRNLQLLHGHCHDEKTALDLEYIRKRQARPRLNPINQSSVWYWKDDILITTNQKAECSNDKDRYVEQPFEVKTSRTVSDGRGEMVTSTSTLMTMST